MQFMKKSYLFLFFCLVTFASVCQKPKILQLTIHPDSVCQTIDGFSASDCWQAQFVGKNWPVEKRNLIADLLFSQKNDDKGNPLGIGLSIWRFNISAGTAEQGDSSGIGNPWRRGEGFLNYDGTYNWQRLQGQQWFLKAAKDRGVEKFLLFPNSPPVQLTNNGKGYATKGDAHLNIKPGKLADYARYMADIVQHFDETGMRFDYLSPFNEPQWSWDDGGQEGTPALNEELFALINYLSHELSRRQLSTRLVIGEAGTIGHIVMRPGVSGQDGNGRNNQANFFFNEQSPFYIGNLPNVEKTISAHSYFSVWPVARQLENRASLGQTLRMINKDLGYWQSEYCILEKNDEIGGGGGRDLGMATAMYVARIIHNDMTLANAKSWQWWTAISQVDFKDGLVYLDDGSKGDSGKMGPEVVSLQHDGMVRNSKLLWILGNYSRFIRPGMVRVKCELSEKQAVDTGLLVSAYADSKNGQKIIVFTNQSHVDISVAISDKNEKKVYVTDETRNLQYSILKKPEIKLPKRSVVTVILD